MTAPALAQEESDSAPEAEDEEPVQAEAEPPPQRDRQAPAGTEELGTPPKPASSPGERPAPRENAGSYTEVEASAAEAFGFSFNGYFRAPALLAIRERDEAAKRPTDTGDFDFRIPRLIDNDFYVSRFAYLPINETGYAELFLSAGNRHVTGTIALASGDYSDTSSTGYTFKNGQKGIMQAFLTLRYAPKLGDVELRTRLKAGAFWERFGHLPKYDTYLFGRTHTTGVQVDADATLGKWHAGVLLGAGYHLPDVRGQQGLTNLLYGRVTAGWSEVLSIELYQLHSFVQDKARSGDTPADGKLSVSGAELGADLPFLGTFRAGLSRVSMEQRGSLDGAVELMHVEKPSSFSDYLGASATKGAMTNLALQADFSARRIANALGGADTYPGDGDVTLSLFNLYMKVNDSDARPPNAAQAYDFRTTGRKGRKYSKWGADLGVRARSWLGASVRFDHVNLDQTVPEAKFHALSPRISFYPSLGFGTNALIYLQYSRYTYGSRITQLGDVTDFGGPVIDRDVFKVQGQMAF